MLVVVLRLAYRLVHGAPEDEPTLEPWHKVASHLNHWGLYVLLIVVPVLGWLGVSYYPALDIFGIIRLPGLVAANQKTAEVVFQYHGIAAFALIALAGMHVGAALYHYLFLGLAVLNMVAAFQALGTLMALGLMLLPAVASSFWARHDASRRIQ